MSETLSRSGPPSVHLLLSDGAVAPRYASDRSSGADLYAFVDAPVEIAPGEREIIPTGVRMAIPEGYEGQVRPRSGLAAKHGVTVLNTPGTVDSDYRGEVKVILINLGDERFTVRSGDRIAQIVFAPTSQVTFARADRLDETSRGEGGFGSTGVSD